MRTPIVVGNWKMNLGREASVALAREVAALAARAEGVEVGVAPVSLWLGGVAAAVGPELGIWGQNVAGAAEGAFTGEHSAAMLREAGACGALIGHSERRHVYGESGAVVAERTRGALEQGLRVILCVGETLAQRRAGETMAVVERQLSEAMPVAADPAQLVIAYEPVWAIGTGETATPEQAQEVHAGIRAWLVAHQGADRAAQLRVQYGGSVKAENAAALIAQPDVDGFLVGGASLKASSFGGILDALAD